MNKRLIWYVSMFVVVSLVVVALAWLTNKQVVAEGSETETRTNNRPAMQITNGQYSGDDVYDSAAGGLTLEEYKTCWIKINGPTPIGQFSGDDLYDPAAGSLTLEGYKSCLSIFEQ